MIFLRTNWPNFVYKVTFYCTSWFAGSKIFAGAALRRVPASLHRYTPANCIPKITRACCALLSAARLFLQHLRVETQIFVNNPRNWRPMDYPASREISLTVGTWLWRLSTVNSELHQQPDAVIRPTFVQKLCSLIKYKTAERCNFYNFTFIQTSKFCLLYWMASKLAHLLDTASKFVLFSMSGMKDEKLIGLKTNLNE